MPGPFAHPPRCTAANALLDQLRRHHRPTADHCVRVAHVLMSVWASEPRTVGDPEPLLIGGAMHDIGKLFVPVTTLDSEHALSATEREMIRMHPYAGAEVLRSLGFPPVIVAAARDHHERWNGGGYPRGCNGEEVHPIARLTAVADAYVAMVEPGRRYRAPLSHEAALAEIRSCRGTQFDPQAADRLLHALSDRSCIPVVLA
ncbi:HD-GYP domain-containing protein [Roseomonas sp. CCTCC AB2023176]|uniref:HD-GYP domain-containing protein n=1 Tax=Roseomonas sp. CCTCC AB2023176 TaxID=3342640 RepID=UPI0035E15E4C